MKVIIYYIPISTPVYVKNLGYKNFWEGFITTKENSFCEDQKIIDYRQLPIKGFTSFRYHNWMLAVKTALIKEKLV